MHQLRSRSLPIPAALNSRLTCLWDVGRTRTVDSWRRNAGPSSTARISRRPVDGNPCHDACVRRLVLEAAMRNPALPIIALVLVAGACERAYPTNPGDTATVPLRITAVTVGVPISTLVVEVTADDIAGPLVFNLSVVDGVASGTVNVPPGPARVIDVTAFDEEGTITHHGSATIDVRPGSNPPLQIRLTPRSGNVPITVTFGNYGVVVLPSTATIDVSTEAWRQLEVTVTDVNGEAIGEPDVRWATTNPTVATVNGSGLVTGLSNGSAMIVATYEGVAGVSPLTVTGAEAKSYVTLVAGWSHTCALTTAGVAYCWGDNGSGELGDGSTTGRATPTPVTMPGVAFSGLAAGQFHSCGVTAAGVAYCWGDNTFGQLGDGTLTDRLIPTAVDMPPAAGLVSLAAGGDHTCGLTAAGEAYCWGNNSDGQLGDGTLTERPTPAAVAMPGGVTFASLAAGYFHTCGVTATGEAYCWGSNADGQLGDGTLMDRPTPTAVASSGAMPEGFSFAALAAGGDHTCGAGAAGNAYCWGTDRDLIPTPVEMPAGQTLASLAAGYSHTCGVTAAGMAYCWGSNGSGQLGDGSSTAQSIPTAVAISGVTFATVAAGDYHSCALTVAGMAYCWGWNARGQLGDGNTTDRWTPVEVLP